ncbi:unnamed protein product, partial [Oppiella nova]
IASCAFGTKIDTYNDHKKTNEFLLYSQKSLHLKLWRCLVFGALYAISPKLLKWTGFQFVDPSSQAFFASLINSIVSKRKSEKVRQRDYLQLLIDAQNRMNAHNLKDPEIHDLNEDIYGKTESTETSSSPKSKSTGSITDTDILATSYLFITAAYETTSTLLSLLFHSLAVNEKCQQRLYEEVSRLDGHYDYESVSQMPYLEACIAETLRLYNPVPGTPRLAAQEYTIPDMGLTIQKGMLIMFDIQSLHHNPEYYPNPDRWDPERFMPENRDQMTPYTYMPFGTGPRNCVGMRFALMEAKTAVAHLVHKYRFRTTPKTTVPPIIRKHGFVLNTEDIHIGIELRK